MPVKIGPVAAAAALVGLLTVGGVTWAFAQEAPSSTTTPPTTAPPTTRDGQSTDPEQGNQSRQGDKDCEERGNSGSSGSDSSTSGYDATSLY